MECRLPLSCLGSVSLKLRVVMSQVSREADDGKKVSRKTLNQ